MGPSRSRKLEHLALELHLVAALRAGLAQRLLELLLGAGAAGYAKAAVRAQDAEAAPRVGLRPVDQEPRQAFVVGGRRLGRRAELEERPADPLAALAGRGRQREPPLDPWVVRLELRLLGPQVDLVQHDHLRPLVESRAVLRELVVDLRERLGG